MSYVDPSWWDIIGNHWDIPDCVAICAWNTICITGQANLAYSVKKPRAYILQVTSLKKQTRRQSNLDGVQEQSWSTSWPVSFPPTSVRLLFSPKVEIESGSECSLSSCRNSSLRVAQITAKICSITATDCCVNIGSSIPLSGLKKQNTDGGVFWNSSGQHASGSSCKTERKFQKYAQGLISKLFWCRQLGGKGR